MQSQYEGYLRFYIYQTAARRMQIKKNYIYKVTKLNVYNSIMHIWLVEGYEDVLNEADEGDM